MLLGYKAHINGAFRSSTHPWPEESTGNGVTGQPPYDTLSFRMGERKAGDSRLLCDCYLIIKESN